MGRRSHTQTLYLWMNGYFVGTWSVRPHTGEIIAYEMSSRPVLRFVAQMVEKAKKRLNGSEKPLIHSDQG